MRKNSEHLRQNRMSVKLKVTLWYACMLVLIVLLLFGFIFFVSRSLLQKKTDSSLEAAVQEFAEEIEFEGDYFELDDDLRFYEDGIIFSVYDDEGRLVAGSVPGNYPVDTVLKAYSFQTLSSGSSSWTVYDAALPYENGQILWVRGILPAQTALSMERTMLIVLLIACPLLIGIALAVGYSITKRAFLPIEEIRQTAENIGEGTNLSGVFPPCIHRVRFASLPTRSIRCWNVWNPPLKKSVSLLPTPPTNSGRPSPSSAHRLNMPFWTTYRLKNRETDWKSFLNRQKKCAASSRSF